MSNLKESERIRFHLAAMESPMFSNFQLPPASAAFSPVTDLAINLNDARLVDTTPRRRLSLSSGDDTPRTSKMLMETDAMDISTLDSPMPENRLLKNAIKLPSSNTTPNFNRVGKYSSRRINLSPVSGLDKCRSPHYNKENNGNITPVLDENSSSVPFIPTGKHVSPTKFTLPRQNSNSPRQRQPLEDYDPNSQDSGYGTTYPDKDDLHTAFRFTEPLGTAPRRHLIDQSPRKENIPTSPRTRLYSESISMSPQSKLIGEIFCMSPRSKSTEENLSPSPKSKVLGENFSPSPRRKSLVEISSPRNKLVGRDRPSLFRSHSNSGGSESGDDFLDLFEFDKLDEDVQLPSGLGSLLSCPLKEQKVSPEQPFVEPRPRGVLFRSHSVGSALSPSYSKARSCLFKTPSPVHRHESALVSSSGSPLLESTRSFKRPDPPCDNLTPVHVKRLKYNSLNTIQESSPNPNSQEHRNLLKFSNDRPPVRLQRSFSETEATIKRALQRSSQFPDLIGDFSKSFVLPLMEGRHQDLKTISPDTLASLMNGEFKDIVNSYSIIDCRYPYEYDGGHISGAKNIYTKDQILKEFVELKNVNSKAISTPGMKRNILIFHCEFSSERGPSLSRFLRNSDRDQNKEFYPALNYPEVYLLHGGYKGFYEKFQDKCEPCSYLPMLDPNHESDLRLFRAKSKSWSGDSKSRLALRNNLKRLGL